MNETAKFTVAVQVTIEDLTELKEVAATVGASMQGAYASILQQCWAEDTETGVIYLIQVDSSSPKDGVVSEPEFGWDTEEPEEGDRRVQLVSAHRWWFEDEAGDQIKIQGGGA